MQPTELRKKLHGVISFPVTPFKKDLLLDLEGLRGNLRSLLKHPVCAIVAPAGTGEIHCLSPAEHLAVVKTTVEEVNGRVPVLTGTGFNPPIAAGLARRAAAAGVDGILAFPPYYPSQDDEGIVAYYRSIAGATPLGLLIYSRDWFAPSPGLVEKLAREIPNLIAWKDGQADIRRYQMIRQHVGDRLHWIGGAGDDMVPAYYSMGIRTYTSSIANVAPKLSLRLHELASAGHSAELTKLMNELVVPLYALRAKRKGYEVSAMKAMMDMMGLAGGPVRPPLVDLRPEEIKALQGADGWRGRRGFSLNGANRTRGRSELMDRTAANDAMYHLYGELRNGRVILKIPARGCASQLLKPWAMKRTLPGTNIIAALLLGVLGCGCVSSHSVALRVLKAPNLQSNDPKELKQLAEVLATNFPVQRIAVGPPAATLDVMVMEPGDYAAKLNSAIVPRKDQRKNDKYQYDFTFGFNVPSFAPKEMLAKENIRGTIFLLHG